MNIPDWNGSFMEVERSRGGVLAACSHRRNLILEGGDEGSIEPAILQKLVASRQGSCFDRAARRRLKQDLGYYCDMQSLNSEDAITWSVFGTIAGCDEQTRARWADELFQAVGLGPELSGHCRIALWNRMPHPETHGSNGPEIDFSVVTDGTILLGECKWTSPVGCGQGRNGDKDQIQMRLECLERFRSLPEPEMPCDLLYSPPNPRGQKRLVVLLVTIDPTEIRPHWTSEGIHTIATTWDRICALRSHPKSDEIERYYRWKLGHTRDYLDQRIQHEREMGRRCRDISFSDLRNLAEEGDPTAMNELGIFLMTGRGVEPDPEEAVRWFGKAAQQGHVDGIFNMGKAFDQGAGVPENERKAVNWWKKAAAAGSRDAMYSLGRLYLADHRIVHRTAKAIHWYECAVAEGDIEAMHALGEIYLGRWGGPFMPERAMELYRKAAEAGHIGAGYILAHHLAHGIHIPQDCEEAARIFEWLAKESLPIPREDIASVCQETEQE